MSLQPKLVFILLFASCAFVSFTGDLLAREAETERDECGPIEGFIQIGIVGSGKSWFHEWSRSGLKLTEKRNGRFSPTDTAPRGSIYGGRRWDEKAAGLPEDFLSAALRLDAPFAVSPDGELLVSSVYPAHSDLADSPSRKLALINRKNKRLIHTFDARWNVDSVAWAPSGKNFAILLRQDVTKDVWKGPIDWWANMVGHPISYYTLYVAMYDLQGKVLCEKRLNERLPLGYGYLTWKASKAETKKSGPPAK
jgi:hypothetical protein